MIHAIHLEDGRASYRNRWVQSRGLMEERAAGRALYPGLLDLAPTEAPMLKNTANTNIVWHAGRLFALMEAALPTQLRPDTLATVGEWDFEGRLAGPMTAHPKMDPVTGEMAFFDFYVLDARHIAGEPIARVILPHRVPYGFHGNWVAA
jgi:carotenoid cleavage dioxygenase